MMPDLSTPEARAEDSKRLADATAQIIADHRKALKKNGNKPLGSSRKYRWQYQNSNFGMGL